MSANVLLVTSVRDDVADLVAGARRTRRAARRSTNHPPRRHLQISRAGPRRRGWRGTAEAAACRRRPPRQHRARPPCFLGRFAVLCSRRLGVLASVALAPSAEQRPRLRSASSALWPNGSNPNTRRRLRHPRAGPRGLRIRGGCCPSSSRLRRPWPPLRRLVAGSTSHLPSCVSVSWTRSTPMVSDSNGCAADGERWRMRRSTEARVKRGRRALPQTGRSCGCPVRALTGTLPGIRSGAWRPGRLMQRPRAASFTCERRGRLTARC